MKMCLLVLTMAIILVSQLSYGDELIVMSNGMTCWRTRDGFVYGCSGGAPTGDTGFNDTRTGRRYERINEGQAVDTWTGRTIETPRQPPRYRGIYDDSE